MSSFFFAMARKRQHRPRPPNPEDELAFPVSFHKQAKYLEMADRFLALGNQRNGNNVIPIDKNHTFRHGKWKKAS